MHSCSTIYHILIDYCIVFKKSCISALCNYFLYGSLQMHWRRKHTRAPRAHTYTKSVLLLISVSNLAQIIFYFSGMTSQGFSQIWVDASFDDDDDFCVIFLPDSELFLLISIILRVRWLDEERSYFRVLIVPNSSDSLALVSFVASITVDLLFFESMRQPELIDFFILTLGSCHAGIVFPDTLYHHQNVIHWDVSTPVPILNVPPTLLFMLIIKALMTSSTWI